MRAGRCGNAAPDRAGGLSRQQLVPAIAPFLHQHPQLHLQLEVTDRLVSLASEGFDLAIRHCRREALPIPTSPGRCVTPRRLPSRPPTIFAAMAARRPRRSAPPPVPDLSPWSTAPAVDVRLRQSPDARVTINVQGHSPPITASRYVMRCWRGLGWRCCRISAPGRPLAAGWCRSCCRRGSQ